MITVEGRQWAHTAEVCAQLGVDRKTLNQWVHRGLVPRPREAGRVWWYDLAECVEAEYATRDRTRPRAA